MAPRRRPQNETYHQSWKGLGSLSLEGKKLKGTWQCFANTQRDPAKNKMVNHAPYPRGEAEKSATAEPATGERGQIPVQAFKLQSTEADACSDFPTWGSFGMAEEGKDWMTSHCSFFIL